VVTSQQGRQHSSDVYRITDARRSHTDDMHSRFVKYTVAMTVRVVCLGLAFVIPGPMRWVCIGGAVVLPYVAVVIANAGREQTPPAPDSWTDPAQPAALSGSEPEPLSPGQQPPYEEPHGEP
jgi:hypothetical protein